MSIEQPNTSTVMMTEQPPVELHYWRKGDIATHRPSLTLCGETGTPSPGNDSNPSSNRPTVICPDCLMRYILLPDR